MMGSNTFDYQCGISLYNNTWVSKDVNEDIFQVVTNDNRFNSGTGEDPLAMRVYSHSNLEVGTYTYEVEVRNSFVNVTEVSFNFYITIEITPCITLSVYNLQTI